jgi:hypothetical protein
MFACFECNANFADPNPWLCSCVSVLFLMVWQISLQCIGAIASGIFFFLWYRLEDADRKKLWRLYGWFTGSSCLGSIFGIAAVCSQMQKARSLIEFSESEAQKSTDVYYRSADTSKWTASTEVPDALQMLFISVPLLMVLDRLIHLAFSAAGSLSSTWVLAKRVALGIVVGFNTLAICFSAASSFYSSQEVPNLMNIGAAVIANNTATALDGEFQLQLLTQKTIIAQSGALISQGASFLVMVVVFAVVFVVCFRRIREIKQFAIQKGTSMQEMRTSANADDSDEVAMSSTVIMVGNIPHRVRVVDAQKVYTQLLSFINDVQSQIVITVVAVFIMLVWIAICLFIDGISQAASNVCNAANQEFMTGSYCNPCENAYSLLQDWLLLSPEFTVLSTYIPGQLAVFVALWGMTSKAMFQSMKGQGQNAF